MDFGGFTNKIKASAEAAAVAARSFKGFDDMAAQDEYIHSDTLNTPVNKRESKQSKSPVVTFNSRRTPEEGDSYSQTGMDTDLSERSGASSWSLLDRPRHDATPKNEENAAAATASKQSRPWNSAKVISEPGLTSSIHSLPDTHSHSPPQRQSTMPLLAADTLRSNNTSGAREKQTTMGKSMPMSNSESNREDDSSIASTSSSDDGFSDDDEEEDDPILSMIRKSPQVSPSSKTKILSSSSSSRRGKETLKPIKKQTQAKMQFLEMEDASPVHQKKMKKNSNRFMEELDQRMAMPELHDNNEDDDDMEAGLLSSSSAKAPAEPSFLWGMLSKGVVSRQQQESNAAVKERKAAPLTRQSWRTQIKPVEESYAVVGSSSVLGEDEIRALAQLKESSARQGMGTACLDKVRRHPRESFIVFTLLLGWVVYFYTKNISLENDVT
jgi:hypothetical protein